MITATNGPLITYWAFVQSAIPGRRAGLLKRTTL